MAAVGGSVPLSRLVDACVQKAYQELAQLLEHKLGNLARPQDKQEALVEFITETRCRFLRLLAVIQWSGKAPLIEACTARLAAFEQHAQVFMATADWLHYQKRELHECCLPLYPVPVAVDVLTTGTYSFLPLSVANIAPAPAPSTAEALAAVAWLDRHLQLRMVDLQLPSFLTSVSIAHGRLWLTTKNLFVLSLTVQGPELTASWRVVSAEILSENAEESALQPELAAKLSESIQGRLAASTTSNPVALACNFLHTFSLQLWLDRLAQQAKELQDGVWGAHLLVTLDAGKRLSLQYWSQIPTAASTLMLELLSQGKDGTAGEAKLAFCHTPVICDPVTNKLFGGVLVDNCLATVLQTAVQAHIHARLLKLQTDLQQHNHSSVIVSYQGSPTLQKSVRLEFCDPTNGESLALLVVAVHPVTGVFEIELYKAPGAVADLDSLKGLHDVFSSDACSAADLGLALDSCLSELLLCQISEEGRILGLDPQPKTCSWQRRAVFMAIPQCPDFVIIASLGAAHKLEYRLGCLTVVDEISQLCFTALLPPSPPQRSAAALAQAQTTAGSAATIFTARTSLLYAQETAMAHLPSLMLARQLQDVLPTHEYTLETVVGPMVMAAATVFQTSVFLLQNVDASQNDSLLATWARFKCSRDACRVVVQLKSGLVAQLNSSSQVHNVNIDWDAEQCTFAYDNIATCVSQFQQDWTAISKLYDLWSQFTSITSPWFAGITGEFKLNAIVLPLESGVLHVSCDGVGKFKLAFGTTAVPSPYDLLGAMFESELNEHGSLEQTVAAVCVALKPLAMIQTCLAENPDLVFTAQSGIMGCLTMGGSSKIAIEVVFLPNQRVGLRDTYTQASVSSLLMCAVKDVVLGLFAPEDGQLTVLPNACALDLALPLFAQCAVTYTSAEGFDISAPLAAVMRNFAFLAITPLAARSAGLTIMEASLSQVNVQLSPGRLLTLRLSLAGHSAAAVQTGLMETSLAAVMANSMPADAINALKSFLRRRILCDAFVAESAMTMFLSCVAASQVSFIAAVMALDVVQDLSSDCSFRLHVFLPSSIDCPVLNGTGFRVLDSQLVLAVRLPVRIGGAETLSFADVVLRYAVPSGITMVWMDSTYVKYAAGSEAARTAICARLQALGPAPPTGGPPLAWAITQLLA